jgi:hypothetical protein
VEIEVLEGKKGRYMSYEEHLDENRETGKTTFTKDE